MDDIGPTASIACYVIFVLINMIFYGFGTAIHAVNEKEIEKKAVDENDRKSKLLLKMSRKPFRYLNTIQLGATLINLLIGGFIFGPLQKVLHSFLSDSLFFMKNTNTVFFISSFITVFIMTYLLLVFGILMPKKAASYFPMKWAYFCAYPVYFTAYILSPFAKFFEMTASGIACLFGVKKDNNSMDVTEEEIISMVNEGHEQGVLQASEAEMITNIFEFGDKEAQDIMTHRQNIVAIDGNMSLQEAISFMLGETKSRYPVYEKDIDHIIGIIHFKDAILALETQNKSTAGLKSIKSMNGLLREVKFIPETRNIDVLFHNMQSLKIQMVMVIDEYGQTAGLIAMEDILEEIVGNIMDEYDEEEAHIEEKSENEFVIEGLTPLEELEERFQISFHEEEFETLNGFLISKMDKIPEENEDFSIDVENYNFKVLSVQNKVIQTVLVTRIQK